MRRRWTGNREDERRHDHCDDDIGALFDYIDQLREDLAVHERHLRETNEDISDY